MPPARALCPHNWKENAMTTAKGTLKHKDWKEKSYNEAKPQKQTEMTSGIELDGDLKAKGNAHMLMHYNDEKTAHYAGHLVLDGNVGGKKGSFVLYEEGAYKGGLAKSKWKIVDGSGTGAFEGISGKGSYEADSENTVHYELEYKLAS
jgi:hypothetical protein